MADDLEYGDLIDGEVRNVKEGYAPMARPDHYQSNSPSQFQLRTVSDADFRGHAMLQPHSAAGKVQETDPLRSKFSQVITVAEHFNSDMDPENKLVSGYPLICPLKDTIEYIRYRNKAFVKSALYSPGSACPYYPSIPGSAGCIWNPHVGFDTYFSSTDRLYNYTFAINAMDPVSILGVPTSISGLEASGDHLGWFSAGWIHFNTADFTRGTINLAWSAAPAVWKCIYQPFVYGGQTYFTAYPEYTQFEEVEAYDISGPYSTSPVCQKQPMSRGFIWNNHPDRKWRRTVIRLQEQPNPSSPDPNIKDLDWYKRNFPNDEWAACDSSGTILEENI